MQTVIDATHTQKVIDKAGSWDRDTHLITYRLDINPSAENLLTSSSGTLDPTTLTLTDVLTYNARQGTGTGEAILSLNSVSLKKKKTAFGLRCTTSNGPPARKRIP